MIRRSVDDRVPVKAKAAGGLALLLLLLCQVVTLLRGTEPGIHKDAGAAYSAQTNPHS